MSSTTPPASGPSDAYAKAIRVWAGCPALCECRRWIESLPVSERPFGMIAENRAVLRERYAERAGVALSDRGAADP
jgi:hypothetical protein